MIRTTALLLGSIAAGAAGIALAAPTTPAANGAELFANNCAACHQPQGEGIAGAFPALAGNTFVQGPPDKVVQTLLDGRGGMPSFRDNLDDAQIAAVITYIRGSWGNKAAPVAADYVATLRKGETPLDRPIPAH